jgi:uncharacterized protein YqeY
MSELRARLTSDMKDCMKSGEKARLTTIRGVLAAIKQVEIDTRTDDSPVVMDDAQVTVIINRLVKQRKDALTQFEAAGRQDLADAERFELGILQAYLPQLLSEAEVSHLVAEAIRETAAKSPADMGKVMSALKQKIPTGRADMAVVSVQVKSQLAG